MIATCAGLPEGFATKDVDSEDDDLGEIREGVNDFKGHGYHGPNPPSGEHTFEFHLYALDAKLKLPKKVSDELCHKTWIVITSICINLASEEKFKGLGQDN